MARIKTWRQKNGIEIDEVGMTTTSCKTCTSRGDCWIRSVIELRTRGDPDCPTYELVLNASRGECLLYIDKDNSTEGC